MGPPSGDGAAWTISGSANASTKTVAVNMVFRFFILFNFLSCLAFLEFSSLSTHFRPFTEVMRKSRREVTRRVGFGSFVLLSCLAFPCVLAISRRPIPQRAQATEGEAEKL
jgi:hypothetical protein